MSGHGGVQLGELLQPVQHVQHHGGDGREPLTGAALPDGVDALFGGVQDLLGGAGALLDHAGQVGRRLGDAPQQGLVLYDGHIFRHVGGGGGDLHELSLIHI